MRVVGGHAGHRAGGFADAVDDRGQDVRQLRADHQEPFGVGLGRSDLQQRDQFGAGGRGVLDQAVMAEFAELLDPDAGVTKCLDRDPGPERPVFFPGQVPAGPGDRVSLQILAVGPERAGARCSTSPWQVNSWPGPAALAAASRPALARA